MNLFLFITIFTYCSYSHPVHIAVTNVEFEKANEKFVVAFKIFSDDLESVIYRKYNVRLNIGKSDELMDAEEYFTKYVKEHFNLFINNDKKNLSDVMVFVKKEIDYEATWLYYEIKFRHDIKKVTIRNSLLDDLYPDQKNLVMFNYNDTNKGFQFNKNDKAEYFEVK
ncbi:MAG: DUF6702 family protein [Bacteroidota bacterium]